MEKEQMRDMLCALLSCGHLDLVVFEGCERSFSEIVEYAEENGFDKDLNGLCCAMISIAKNEFQNSVEERITELENNTELSETESEELKALRELEPQDDIESFHNFLDTSVYFAHNEDIYRKYCEEEIKVFEDNSGFDL